MNLRGVRVGLLEVPLRVQFDPVQVIIVKRQAAQRCIGSLGQLFQPGLVEAPQQDAAVAVGAWLTVIAAQHAVIAAAHGQYQHL
ncbi:hypothetical protein D9M71_202980 [compost metagenome]